MGVGACSSTAAAAAAATSTGAPAPFGLGQGQASGVVRVLVRVETFVGDLKDGAILHAELQLLQNSFAVQAMRHGHGIANALL